MPARRVPPVHGPVELLPRIGTAEALRLVRILTLPTMRIGGVVPPREVAARFGLDVVLGAFLAGMVLRRWAPDDTHCLEEKVNAIDYGFSIPVFFVMSGMNLDVDVLRQCTTDELRRVAQLPCEREVYGGRVAGSVSVPPERTQEPREGATQGGSGRARPRGR